MSNMLNSGRVAARLLRSAQQQSYATAAVASTTVLIKQLRDRSGAPISDVKSCLSQTDWDVERAFVLLREKGLAAAAKKASRHAAQGLVGVAVSADRRSAAVVEINSETDFVARNDLFQALVAEAAQAALQLHGSDAGLDRSLDVQQLASSRTSGGASVSDRCADVALQVRENVRLRRAYRLDAPGPSAVVAAYIHGSIAPGLGRIAGLVALDGCPQQGDLQAQAQELAYGIAMHAVGMNSRYVDSASVPPEVVAREEAIFQAQAAGSSKPAAVIAKMVQGRMRKFYDEHCLLNQRYLLDDADTVGSVLQRFSRQHGLDQPVRVAEYLRVQCGEGLTQEHGNTNNFAAEVASVVNSSRQ